MAIEHAVVPARFLPDPDAGRGLALCRADRARLRAAPRAAAPARGAAQPRAGEASRRAAGERRPSTSSGAPSSRAASRSSSPRPIIAATPTISSPSSRSASASDEPIRQRARDDADAARGGGGAAKRWRGCSRRTRRLCRALGERLRATPPRFVVTCARGSSDSAATYAKYLIEIRLGVVVASVGPSISSIYGAPAEDARRAVPRRSRSRAAAPICSRWPRPPAPTAR